jgi:diguanylate cyclase (GGDEF)-like protein
MAALVAVLAVLQALAYVSGWKDIQDQLESGARGVAVSVAQLLMTDIDDYRAFLETKDAGSAYYRKMQHLLSTIRDESGAAYIYTERRLDEETTEYILDAEPAESSKHSPPGELETMDPEKALVFAGKAHASNMTDDDKWGMLITSYAPVFDESGAVLSLVGVDIEGDHMVRQFRRINVAMAVASLVIVCLSLALLIGFSDRILGYMLKDRLTGAFTTGHFKRELVSRIPRSAKHSHDLALVMVEPDPSGPAWSDRGFRARALAHVSGAIRDSIRPDECLARYGKRGFALIVASAGARNIAEMAERLRQAIGGRPMPGEEGMPAHLTVSIGVAVGGGQSQSADDLLEKAKEALAMAKAKGNSVVILDAGAEHAG